MNDNPAKNASSQQPNPLIAGLGRLPETPSELLARMTPDAPVPTPEMRQLGQVQRFIELGAIEDFYFPTATNVSIALRTLTKVIWGYKRRPPSASYWLNHQTEAEALAAMDTPPPRGTAAPSFAVIGTSGMGKTTAIDMALGLFKRTVRHDQSTNPLLPRIQIPALKVTCPVNRTVSAFIDEFFVEVAQATGIDYTPTIRGLNVDQRIIAMGRTARLHFLGALVFDEVQNMAGGDDQLKRLLVRMTNTIQLPIIFVGTPKGWNELSEELATSRRMTGEVWKPFRADDPDWQDIISSLWQYQLTRTETKLDQPLRNKMNELTCGVPAVAKALFTFAQEELIINSDPTDPEIITPELLDFVFADKMAKVAPAMKALRTGVGLEAFQDLLPEKWPTPNSWGNDDKLADLLQGVFQDSAVRAARRGGKAFALSQFIEKAS